MQNDASLKERLRFRRNRLDLTQEALAERSGISVRSITDYERGESHPSLEQLSKLAAALDVTSGWLLGESNEELKEASSRSPTELSSAYAHMEIETLQKNFAELAGKIGKVSAADRKYIFGNLRAMLDELEDRNLKYSNLTADEAANLAGKRAVESVLKPAVVYGRKKK